jgi:hypothetical protein
LHFVCICDIIYTSKKHSGRCKSLALGWITVKPGKAKQIRRPIIVESLKLLLGVFLRRFLMHKVLKAYTLTPTAVKSIESLCNATGMDASAIVNGAVEAVWAAVLSGGHRKFPSIITALRLTGPAKSGFYIGGKKEDET